MARCSYMIFIVLVILGSTLAKPNKESETKQVANQTPEVKEPKPIVDEDKPSNIKKEEKENSDDKVTVTQPITVKEELKPVQPPVDIRFSEENSPPKDIRFSEEKPKLKVTPRALDGFQYHATPVHNPLFDYAHNDKQGSKIAHKNINTNEVEESYVDVDSEKAPEGQYIKSKVIHTINYLVPSSMVNQAMMQMQAMQMQGMGMQGNPGVESTFRVPSDMQHQQPGMMPQYYAPGMMSQDQQAYDMMLKNPYINNQAQVYPAQQPFFYSQPMPQYQSQPNVRQQQFVVPIYNHMNEMARQTTSIPNPIPGLPAIPWPFGSFFPILIKDPIQTLLSGSSTYIQMGSNVKVCDSAASASSPQAEYTLSKAFVKNSNSPIVAVTKLPSKP